MDNATCISPSCVSTLKTAIHYHSTYNFNVIPIPKPCENKGQCLEDGDSRPEVAMANGKSAAGYESWKDLQLQS
jgi:hypothetical protein